MTARPTLVVRADRLDGLILRTPTVPIEDDASGCTIWVKLEYLQPSGSTKDRLAAFVLGKAIRSGEIEEGTTVVEASSGSTSIALAMACAQLGLRFVAVMPEGVSSERVLIIRRYGGEVELVEGGAAAAIDRTEALAANDASVFLPRQFANPGNVEAHARGTGPELLDAVGRPLDGFVAGVGTAGTLMGVARAIRAAGHDRTRIAAVRPITGDRFAGQPEICAAFSTGIPGVVENMSTLLDPSAVGLEDDLDVADDLALDATRELCALGFPVGLSSGLNLVGARLLATDLGPGHHVATVLCDRMERYFSTGLFDDLPLPS
jgi:cysteine synthase A